VSLAPDGRSVVVELVDPAYRVFGATEVKITAQTNFDRALRMSGSVGAGGAAKGSSELPLAPGAPAVGARQPVVIECFTGSANTGLGTSTAEAAPAGAPRWKLAAPLSQASPEGADVWYQTQVHVGRFADLHLRVGQSVVIELEGVPGDYHATKLTDAGLLYRHR
jgi:hypothetical protein